MSKKSFSKRLLTYFGYAVAVLIVLLIAAWIFIDGLISTGIKTIVPIATKCDADVENVDLSFVNGTLEINNLVIKNPEGFKSPEALCIGRVYISLLPSSLFSNVIVVKEVQISGLQATYEIGFPNSNLGKILDNLDGKKSDNKDKEKEVKEIKKEKDSGSSKKVVIDHVLVEDGKLNLSLKVAAVPIPLPKVELHDLGRSQATETEESTSEEEATPAVKSAESEGVGIADAIKEILQSVLSSIVNAAKKATSLF